MALFVNAFCSLYISTECDREEWLLSVLFCALCPGNSIHLLFWGCPLSTYRMLGIILNVERRGIETNRHCLCLGSFWVVVMEISYKEKHQAVIVMWF